MQSVIFNWLGAAALAAAPFLINLIIGKLLAIIGLILLTVQAVKLQAYNLVMLNLIGVIGYLYSLVQQVIA